MSEHTPLPWSWCRVTDKRIFVEGSDGHFLANVQDYSKMDGANAEFIVRACNSHYELVEILECMLKIASEDEWNEAMTGRQLIFKDAKATLAKAKGETPCQ